MLYSYEHHIPSSKTTSARFEISSFTYSLESRLIFFISLLEDSSIKLYFYSNSSLGVYLFINLTDEEKKINIF